MSKLLHKIARITALGAALLCLLPSISAQQSQLSPIGLQEIEERLANTQQLISNLEVAAESCVTNEVSSRECEAFASILNGNVLGEYLQQCQALKEWRENLAEETTANSVPEQLGQQVLQHLMDIELRCGEDALIRRTDFVLTAWNKINSSAFQSGAVATTLPNQTANDALNYRMRSSLLNGVDSQQQRIQLETQQLWQRLEMENLRQQNRQVIDVSSPIQ